jgi:hypothetical protein
MTGGGSPPAGCCHVYCMDGGMDGAHGVPCVIHERGAWTRDCVCVWVGGWVGGLGRLTQGNWRARRPCRGIHRPSRAEMGQVSWPAPPAGALSTASGPAAAAAVAAAVAAAAAAAAAAAEFDAAAQAADQAADLNADSAGEDRAAGRASAGAAPVSGPVAQLAADSARPAVYAASAGASTQLVREALERIISGCGV